MVAAAVVALVLAVGVQLPSSSRNALVGVLLILGISIGLARLTLYLVTLCVPLSRDVMRGTWALLSVAYLVGLVFLLALWSFMNM